MTPDEFLLQYSPYLFLVYILIKEGMPIIRSIAESTMPELIAKRKTMQERELDLREKEADNHEREITVLEGMHRRLTIIENNQDHFRDNIQVVMNSLNVTTQSLALLLDRSYQRRKGDDVNIHDAENVIYSKPKQQGESNDT